jgi:hypothetical protein
LTPREISRETNGQVERLGREQNDREWLAWHIAALQRAKKFPKFTQFMTPARRSSAASKPQSPDMQLANMKAIYIAFGGDPQALEKFNGR